mgnify:FL=1|tara:strand:+ start:632 stop:1027 length:396 start_codon:yes stop_codon:yes gene_type:complete
MISIISKTAAFCAASFFVASSAIAGTSPYVNIENNTGFTGLDEFLGGATDLHVGVQTDLGDSGLLYLQGGPRLDHVKDQDMDQEYSAKLGASIDLSDQFNLYGEVLAVTNDKEFSTDTFDFGTKIGVKFVF